MENSEFVLETRGISKSFPGVKALDNVTLRIRPGTVHALMGENGAGKSTLMKCIYGIYSPDEGKILINNEEVHIVSPRDAMDHHISMIHQELHPVKNQNVMENIFLGRIPYKKVAGIRWSDEKELYKEADAVLKKLDINLNPRTKVGTLSTSYCQLVEIARAVSIGAKVVIMDEPTSSLTEGETKILFRIIQQLKNDNVAIIYISHKMDEIMQISDEVTVMRDGKLIGTWPASEMTEDLLISKMVGRTMTNHFPPKIHTPGEKCLEVSHLTSANPRSFKDISFDVHKGEIFGIGGLVGAQRSELMEAVFGLRAVAGGTISIDGKPVTIHEPINAIKNGMALLTEDRRGTGIMPALNITENILVVNNNANRALYKKGKFSFLNEAKRREDAKKYVDMLSIKTPSLKTQIASLSGGNQQKVLLGRWLLSTPNILVLDEPTRGIDVGAKYEIYELMEQMAKEGKCVIMISSEMPELMGMSDRIMVMCEGHNSGIIDGKTATDEEIMRLASSYKHTKQEEKAA